MAGKSDTFENQLLRLIFNGTAISGIAGIDPNTSLWCALHTGNPDESGNQSTNEANYTGYARVRVTRDSAGWIVTGSSVSPAQDIYFPEATGGSSQITHFTVGMSQTGPGTVLYYGQVSPVINVTAGILPRITTASTISED